MEAARKKFRNLIDSFPILSGYFSRIFKITLKVALNKFIPHCCFDQLDVPGTAMHTLTKEKVIEFNKNLLIQELATPKPHTFC